MDRAELETVAQGSHGESAQCIQWWLGTLRIRSPDREVLEWARHHLTTTRGPRSGGKNQTVIRAMADARLASRLRAELEAHPTEHFYAYSGDPWEFGRIARCRAWARRKPIAGPIIVEVSPGKFLLVGHDSGEVARSTVRLAREALRTELAIRGAVTLHASFAGDESLGGTLFVGPSGSGKTTLAIALARTGWLVSGDQTEVLRRTHSMPVGVGFPWALSVSEPALRSAGLDIDVRRVRLMRTAPAGKFEFTQLEAAEILGIRTRTDLPIDIVVVIEPAPMRDVPAAYASDLVSCGDALERETREPDPAFPSFWLAPQHVDETTYADIVGTLRGTRVVRLAWDPACHRAAEALAVIRDSG